MRLLVVCSILLVASCHREDRLKKQQSAVFAVRPIPPDKSRETTAGGTVQIGLQALDEDESGVDGAPVMFFLASGDEFTLKDHPERNVRITTELGSIDGVQASGLAAVSISAADTITTETKISVYGNLLDDFDPEPATDASTPEAARFDVVEFTITVPGGMP